MDQEYIGQRRNWPGWRIKRSGRNELDGQIL